MESDGNCWRTVVASTSDISYFDGASVPDSYRYKLYACNDFDCKSVLSPWIKVHNLGNPAYGPYWTGVLTGNIVVPEDAAASAISPQDHNTTVGALQGAGSVTGGAASYTIPIILPPGKNGLQPAISTGYSSRAGNGALGMGWSLNAGSAISRCPQTIAQDGQMEPVQYLASDRLCLDGQRLILVSGTYGSSGAIYRTEQDTFARVTQAGAINGSSTWFKVELKNGMMREYGHSADSRHIDSGVAYIKSWALTREKDSTANNTIVYEYASFSQGERLLSNIFYMGSASSTGNREVEILYETRPDLSSAYLPAASAGKLNA